MTKYKYTFIVRHDEMKTFDTPEKMSIFVSERKS